MSVIAAFFYRKSTWGIALIFTLLTFGYLYFVMIPEATCFQISGGDGQSLGTSFGFTYQTLVDYFAKRSTLELMCFQNFNLLWDTIFALLYGLMYTFWLAFLFKPYAHKVKFLILLPLLQTVFDWLENFRLIELANDALTKQVLSTTNAQLATAFSMSKWVVAMLVFLFVIIGIGFRIRYAVKRKKWQKNH